MCGHHIGLKQSPSVVFSSSSDLMVERQAGSDHSSSDENQYADGDSKSETQANQAQQVHVRENYVRYALIVRNNPLTKSLGDAFR